MTEILQLSITELASGAIDRLLNNWTSDLYAPLVVIPLEDASDETLTSAIQRLKTTDRIVIGTWANTSFPVPSRLEPLLTALNTTYSSYQDTRPQLYNAKEVAYETHLLSDALRLYPQTIHILASTLKNMEDLPPSKRLDIESLAYSALLAGQEFKTWLTTAQATNPKSPPITPQSVRVKRRKDTLLIKLARPERRNAFGAQMRHEFVSALQIALSDESISSVVVDGEGPTFCAGGDLGEFGTTSDYSTAHLVRTRGGPGRLITQLGDRIMFRVHGACVGAGVELPSLSQHVMAASTSTFLLPEISMGLIPGAGGTAGIPARIGRWRTFAMCATKKQINATTALSWGLIDEIDTNS